jgi:hypothetical protein
MGFSSVQPSCSFSASASSHRCGWAMLSSRPHACIDQANDVHGFAVPSEQVHGVAAHSSLSRSFHFRVRGAPSRVAE